MAVEAISTLTHERPGDWPEQVVYLGSGGNIFESTATTDEETVAEIELPLFDSANLPIGFRVLVTGRFAANTNTKRVRIKFEDTVIADTTAIAGNDVAFRIDATITGYAAQKSVASSLVSVGTTNTAGSVLTTEDWGAQPPADDDEFAAGYTAQKITVTSQNGTANAEDVVIRQIIIQRV